MTIHFTRRRVLLSIISIIALFFLLVGAFLSVWNVWDNGTFSIWNINTTTIFVYDTGKRVAVDPHSELFVQIQNELEQLFITNQGGFLTLYGEKKIKPFKKEGAIEIIYSPPHIFRLTNYLGTSYDEQVYRLFFPLKRGLIVVGEMKDGERRFGTTLSQQNAPNRLQGFFQSAIERKSKPQ